MSYSERQRNRYRRGRDATKTESSGRWFRVQDGENLIRVIPFMHTVTKGDMKLGRYHKDDCAIGEEIEEFFSPFRMHFRPKPHPCGIWKRAVDGNEMGECETCEDQREMARSKSKSDQQAAFGHRAQQKYAMLVVNMEPSDGVHKIQVWEAPGTIVDYILDCMDSRKYRNKNLFGGQGLDLLIKFNSKAKSPRDYYQLLEFMDADQSDTLDIESLEGEVTDLYRVLKYVPEAFHDYIEDGIGGGQEAEDTRGSRQRQSPRRERKQKPEPEESHEEEPPREETVDYASMPVAEIRALVIKKGLLTEAQAKGKRKPTLIPILLGEVEPAEAKEDEAEWTEGMKVIVNDGDEKLEGVISGEPFEDDGKTWIPVTVDGEEYDTEPHELEVA